MTLVSPLPGQQYQLEGRRILILTLITVLASCTRDVHPAVLNSLNSLVYGVVAYGLIGMRASAFYLWRTMLIVILSHLSLIQVHGRACAGTARMYD